MPSKKKKYNARFPAGRIKKIMQTDEEVGKVAQAVPVIISRTLELFVESLLTKTMQITMAKSAKTLSPSHMKQCILSENRFDFLKDLVKGVPDSLNCDDEGNTSSSSSTVVAPSTAAQSSYHYQKQMTLQNQPSYSTMNTRTSSSPSSSCSSSSSPATQIHQHHLNQMPQQQFNTMSYCDGRSYLTNECESRIFSSPSTTTSTMCQNTTYSNLQSPVNVIPPPSLTSSLGHSSMVDHHGQLNYYSPMPQPPPLQPVQQQSPYHHMMTDSHSVATGGNNHYSNSSNYNSNMSQIGMLMGSTECSRLSPALVVDEDYDT